MIGGYTNATLSLGRSSSSLVSSWNYRPPSDTSFAYSVSGAGDLNADGFTDIVIGSPQYTNGTNNGGAVYVYMGSTIGLVSPPRIIESDVNNAYFGVSVSGAGDVNADGYADIVVGASLLSNVETNEGRIMCILVVLPA